MLLIKTENKGKLRQREKETARTVKIYEQWTVFELQSIDRHSFVWLWHECSDVANANANKWRRRLPFSGALHCAHTNWWFDWNGNECDRKQFNMISILLFAAFLRIYAFNCPTTTFEAENLFPFSNDISFDRWFVSYCIQFIRNMSFSRQLFSSPFFCVCSRWGFCRGHGIECQITARERQRERAKLLMLIKDALLGYSSLPWQLVIAIIVPHSNASRFRGTRN